MYQPRNHAVYSLQYTCVVTVVVSTEVSRGSFMNFARGVFTGTPAHVEVVPMCVFTIQAVCEGGGMKTKSEKEGRAKVERSPTG